MMATTIRTSMSENPREFLETMDVTFGRAIRMPGKCPYRLRQGAAVSGSGALF
jgi:hypothetical protein